MRIPNAYQSQALTSLPAIQTQNREENSGQDQEQSMSVSMRLGKLGITYSSQDISQNSFTSSDTDPSASRIPTASFAQEFSLALAQSSTTVADNDFSGMTSQTSSYQRHTALQSYAAQNAFAPSVSTQNISFMV